MSIVGSEQWMYASGGSYQINDSLRFEDGSGSYLYRTPAVAGNRKTWTFSCWFKRGNLGLTYPTIFSTNDIDAGQYTSIIFSNETLYLNASGVGANYTLITNQVFRDINGWYHLVWSVDTTQATSTDRMKLYINGEQVTSFSTAIYPSLNKDLDVNAVTQHSLGYFADYGRYWDGYLSDIYLIDGQALDPTDFGETIDGYWRPVAYSGSYGTNGFHLDFNGNTNDASGNGNNWTAANISAHDYVPDSPTNNFATLNPVFPHLNMTFSEGNLRWTTTTNNRGAMGNFSIPIGTGQKYYFEYVQTGWANVSGDDAYVGLNVDNVDIDSNRGGRDTSYSYGANAGNKVINGIQTSYGVAWGTGDIIGIAVDRENNTVNFAKNNAYQGTFAIPATGNLFAWIGSGGGFNAASGVWNFGQDSTFAGTKPMGAYTDDNGIGNFQYAPPAGYLALCTANLPTPTIIDGSEHFNTVLWSGDGVDGRTITSGSFDPDFVWIKSRSVSSSHLLNDTIRGGNASLFSEGTNAETANNGGGYLSGFTTNGFTVTSGGSGDAAVNDIGNTYVGWSWKAGGTAVSNTDGSITSQVSANVDAGFSVVSYSPSGSSGSVGHGLGVTPDAVIVKRRDAAGNWVSHWPAISGTNKQLYLNLTNAVDTNNISSLTSTTFSVSGWSDVATAGGSYVAYCFANTEGYLKAGSYTGNGSSDGPFVYTGFRPAWVMVKRTDAAGNWIVMDSERDTYNVTDALLSANESAAESVDDKFDFLSNGFKNRDTGSWNNASGGSYIYLAFAEHPFKYSNAR